MQTNRPSIDLVYDLAQGHYQTIAQWADSLDNKVVGLFSLSTIIITVITGFTAKSIALDWHVTPLCIGALAFLTHVVLALKSYQARDFMLGYDPAVLLEQYAALEVDKAKYWIMKYDGQNWEHNRQVINAKADSLRWAIVFAAIEVVALLVWLAVFSLS